MRAKWNILYYRSSKPEISIFRGKRCSDPSCFRSAYYWCWWSSRQLITKFSISKSAANKPIKITIIYIMRTQIRPGSLGMSLLHRSTDRLISELIAGRLYRSVWPFYAVRSLRWGRMKLPLSSLTFGFVPNGRNSRISRYKKCCLPFIFRLTLILLQFRRSYFINLTALSNCIAVICYFVQNRQR